MTKSFWPCTYYSNTKVNFLLLPLPIPPPRLSLPPGRHSCTCCLGRCTTMWHWDGMPTPPAGGVNCSTARVVFVFVLCLLTLCLMCLWFSSPVDLACVGACMRAWIPLPDRLGTVAAAAIEFEQAELRQVYDSLFPVLGKQCPRVFSPPAVFSWANFLWAVGVIRARTVSVVRSTVTVYLGSVLVFVLVCLFSASLFFISRSLFRFFVPGCGPSPGCTGAASLILVIVVIALCPSTATGGGAMGGGAHGA
jgi:hypothetical protein